MGATVDRPAPTYTLDAVYDMEVQLRTATSSRPPILAQSAELSCSHLPSTWQAAPFFEIASMLSEPQLIASVKVVAGLHHEP